MRDKIIEQQQQILREKGVEDPTELYKLYPNYLHVDSRTLNSTLPMPLPNPLAYEPKGRRSQASYGSSPSPTLFSVAEEPERIRAHSRLLLDPDTEEQTSEEDTKPKTKLPNIHKLPYTNERQISSSNLQSSQARREIDRNGANSHEPVLKKMYSDEDLDIRGYQVGLSSKYARGRQKDRKAIELRSKVLSLPFFLFLFSLFLFLLNFSCPFNLVVFLNLSLCFFSWCLITIVGENWSQKGSNSS